MEKAPWKLNKEMADVMGGVSSELYQQYKQRCIQAFSAARKYAKEAITMIEIMQFHSNFPAFRLETSFLLITQIIPSSFRLVIIVMQFVISVIVMH
jgi:phosphatidylinositol kinase/protein kinase (PI-3  family)